MATRHLTPLAPDDQDGPGNATSKLVALLGNPYGIEVVADTSAHTNSGKGYFCIENAASGVIATVTASDINDGTAVTAYTLGAGERLFGRISTFTLTSGKVKAYRNP